MIITVLRDILIARGQLENYYEGLVPVNLWRATNRKRPTALFDFVEREFVLSNGRPRPADIKIEDRGGIAWVTVTDRPRGVSTFDKPGIPAGKDWDYIKIPKNTTLSGGLAIVDDGYREAHDANHYTIAPAHDMPLAEFRALLAQLAEILNAKGEVG